MTFFMEHLPQTLMVLGLLALIIEVGILGFGSLVLFFLGVSLLLSGMLMTVGLLPVTGTAALLANAVMAGALALVLWKPLKRMQDDRQQQRVDQDFAPDDFILKEAVDISGNTSHRYSGIDWQLRSERPIEAGTRVRVDHADVGVLWVVPVEKPD